MQSAFFRPHNRSEDVKHLYLVGAGTHPGAGLPGVLSTARVLDIIVPDVEHFEKKTRENESWLTYRSTIPGNRTSRTRRRRRRIRRVSRFTFHAMGKTLNALSQTHTETIYYLRLLSALGGEFP